MTEWWSAYFDLFIVVGASGNARFFGAKRRLGSWRFIFRGDRVSGSRFEGLGLQSCRVSQAPKQT